jgi:hypothetical protein
VTRTFWLASYPKSGNTWMRTLIANLASSDSKPVDINKLPPVGMASERHPFDHTLLIDSGLLTHDEIDRLRPRLYEALMRYSVEADSETDGPARFVKAHDAYTINSAGEPLLGGAGAAHGAILIVRDPRDVASSLAHHSGKSIDHAIKVLNDPDKMWCERTSELGKQLRQKLCDWSSHTASWLEQTNIPVHLVRYEDLLSNTVKVLTEAMAFAGVPTTTDDIKRAALFSDFTRLRLQEEQNGFKEAPRLNANFFRRGVAGSWREELTREQVARIESRHARLMLRLGYELSYAELARAG